MHETCHVCPSLEEHPNRTSYPTCDSFHCTARGRPFSLSGKVQQLPPVGMGLFEVPSGKAEGYRSVVLEEESG